MDVVIAEKPELGRAIANAMHSPLQFDRKKQVITTIYKGRPTTIFWCYGHLLTLWEPEDFDLRYSIWRLDDLPLCPGWRYKVRVDKSNRQWSRTLEERVKMLGELLSSAERVIHAGDIDDEGQLLIDELLHYHNYQGPVLRLNTNDTCDAGLKRALENMVPNGPLMCNGLSALGRQFSDMIFGFNLSRYFTIINGGHVTLPVGRVKMPTLGLVVARDQSIESHVKSCHFTLYVSLSIENSIIDCRVFPPDDDGHIDKEHKWLNKDALEGIGTSLIGETIGDISITKEMNEVPPPLPFNQNKLYSFCAAAWDLQPNQVKAITQDLRDKYHAITYNRSDCQYLSMDTHAEAPQTIPQVCKNLDILSSPFDPSIKSRCFDDANITAHMAIIPTMSAQQLCAFSPDERRVYDIIARYYLIQFLPPAKKEITRLSGMTSGGCYIEAVSSKITFPGYLTMLQGLKPLEEDESPATPTAGQDSHCSLLSELNIGQYPAKIHFSKTEKVTSRPPAPYTAASLIKDMSSIAKYVENEKVRKLLLSKDKGKKGENGSIGTPATRDIIVSELIKAGYIKEQKNGMKTILVSTDLGRLFYESLPDSVRKVDVSAKWWYEQEMIKEGKLTPDQMAQDVLKTVNAIIKGPPLKMDLSSPVSKGVLNNNVLGPCPLCGGEVMETNRGYVCLADSCHFFVSKSNRYIAALGKELSPTLMSELLIKKKASLHNCKSRKSGKTFDTTLIPEFTEKGISFRFATEEELDVVGSCPLCGNKVIERGNRFACSSQDCTTVLWRHNKLVDSISKEITADIAKSLLSTGKAKLTKCLSKKTGKKFDCTLCVDFCASTPPGLRLEFDFTDAKSGKRATKGTTKSSKVNNSSQGAKEKNGPLLI